MDRSNRSRNIAKPVSKPLQDQTNQQDIDDITQSTSVESMLHPLPKPSHSGDDGWTDDSMAELDKELGLALEEQQVEPAHLPPQVLARSKHHRTRPRVENTPKLPVADQKSCKILLDMAQLRVLRSGSNRRLRWWKKGLGTQLWVISRTWSRSSTRTTLKTKEATEALPAAQPKIPKIDEHRFRLRGVRARQFARRQIKTTQYRVVWGQYPNRSDSWFNEDDVRMSMPWPPCERSSQYLVPQVERDVMRVHHMRCSRRSKGRKIFEYLVDALSTWVTEDQLRISLSPTLLTGLKGK